MITQPSIDDRHQHWLKQKSESFLKERERHLRSMDPTTREFAIKMERALASKDKKEERDALYEEIEALLGARQAELKEGQP